MNRAAYCDVVRGEGTSGGRAIPRSAARQIIFQRFLAIGGILAASIFSVVAVAFALPQTDGQTAPVAYAFLGCLSGLVLATGATRIELRRDTLCIVNLGGVRIIGRAAISWVRAAPQLTVHTVDGADRAALLFSPSLGARVVNNYAGSRRAADQINDWRAQDAAGDSTMSRWRPRWELALYAAPFVAAYYLVAWLV